MASKAMEKINRENMRDDVAQFAVGDTVMVQAKIYEGGKERVQVFGGMVIARDGGGATETFTVRRVSHGVGVEKIFPVHSPHIAKIEVVRSAHVRRAKLYFTRGLGSKKAKLRLKRKGAKAKPVTADTTEDNPETQTEMP